MFDVFLIVWDGFGMVWGWFGMVLGTSSAVVSRDMAYGVFFSLFLDTYKRLFCLKLVFYFSWPRDHHFRHRHVKQLAKTCLKFKSYLLGSKLLVFYVFRCFFRMN